MYSCYLILFLYLISVHAKYTGQAQWDPEPLEPQFWQPARLIEGFNLEHAKENPCSRIKEAIQIEGLFGRLNNYLIELVHMLEVAVLSEDRYMVVIGPHYDEITGNHINLINITKRFACVKRFDDKGIKSLDVRKIDVKQIYRQKENSFNEFRGHVLSRLLLTPSSVVRKAVESFESENNLTSGYNALHLRRLEGKCVKSMKVAFHDSYSYVSEIGRNITATDICDMTNEYVRWKLQKAGTAHLPLVLVHDGQNQERLHDLLQTFHSVSTNAGQKPEEVITDMILLIRAKTFIPNLVSTFSDNVQHARRVIHATNPLIT